MTDGASPTQKSEPELAAVGVRADAAVAPDAAMGKGDTGAYYSKWDKLAAEAVAEAEESDAVEVAESTKKLGLDSDAPLSEAQKKDEEKRAALREAKKSWDGVEAKREEMKMVITGERGPSQDCRLQRTLEFEGDLTGRRVLVLKDCTDVDYELPAELNRHDIIKVYIEGCTRCTIDLHCKLMTSLLEVCHCEGCRVEVRHPTHTFQVDLCENTTLWFGQNVLQPGHKVYSAGNRGLQIEFDWLGTGDCSERCASIDNFAMSGLPAAQAAEAQFVTQLTNLAKTDTSEVGLKTELVARDAGQHPTTQRELQERKDEIAASLRARGIDQESIDRASAKLDAPSAEAMAENHKAEGNAAFKERDYVQASVSYMQAIQALVSTKQTAETVSTLCACYSNRAACQLKLGDHESALKDAIACVELDGEHVKGLFRQGVALHALGRFREACPVLGKALSLQPKNQQIKDALMFAERNAAKPENR